MQRIVTTAPRTVSVTEAPVPEPRSDDALIGIEAVGICGSDVHLYLGDHPYSRFPNVQGHELAGRVLALPPRYSGAVSVGDLVVIEPLLTCGNCLPCQRGRNNACLRMKTLGVHVDGGLVEQLAVPVSTLYPAGDLSPTIAALVEPFSIAVHAVGRAGKIVQDDQVVVLGAGPIGQAISIAVQELGAQVLVVDRHETRLNLAKALGAFRTCNTAEQSLSEAVSEWCPEGPVIVFEATGASTLVEAAVDVLATTGTVVLVGLSNEKVSLSIADFTRREMTVLGSRNSWGEFAAATELVTRHRESLQRLITHKFPMSEAGAALEFALNNPSKTQKVMLTSDAAG